MTLFERIDKHKSLYLYVTMAVYILINNTINASSVWMEHNRNDDPGIQFWEPFAWEYSSALSTLLILPALLWMLSHYPPRLTKIKQQLLLHFAGTIVFSLAHIGLMVAIRHFIYWLDDGNYNFGPWWRELWYEYRKDAWGYILFICFYQMVQIIFARLKGEANPIAENENDAEHPERQQVPEHFLVKKLDKEFLVKVSDIEWLESCGNYVNLHSSGRIYPLRATLSDITSRLAGGGFSRIHRSHAINHNAIDSISYLASGDGEVQLKSGQTLKLSRRYKDEFKEKLS